MDAQGLANLPNNLKIILTDEQGIPIQPSVPFVVMFNPESFSISEEIAWDPATAPGNPAADPVFKLINPRSFSIDFTIDGTGINTNGIKIPVTAQVFNFRMATSRMKDKDHRPPYLLVQYGPFISTCILKSSSITYTMFDMSGVPIRAKISASFTERTPKLLGNIISMFSSPDLTHKVVVKEGDLLPLLTNKMYKNQQYFLQVAKVNKLKNFRKLNSGTTLIFPPIAKK